MKMNARFNTASGTRCCNFYDGELSEEAQRVFQYRKRYALLQLDMCDIECMASDRFNTASGTRCCNEFNEKILP